MFPDSIIAQHMSCGPTKLSYLISFGIVPYFMDLLLKELKDAPCFVISFDESFNEELEKEQMDFIVRYFKDGEVKSRYLSSGEVGLEKPHSGIYGWTKHQLENARLDCRRQELK